MRFLFLICLLCLPRVLSAFTVDAFLDAYAETLAETPAISADIICADSSDGGRVGTELRGLSTFHGGDDPFLRLTLSRSWPNSAREATPVIASVHRDRVLLADGAANARYDTRLSHNGAHLLSSSLNSDLLLLMYPQMLDSLRRDRDARIEEEIWQGMRTRVLNTRVDDRDFSLRVEAQSFLPLQIVRVSHSWRGEHTSTITLLNLEVAKGPPPPELFEIGAGTGYPLKRYDPSELRGLKEAPDFKLLLNDKNQFRLSQQRGKYVVLYFCADWSASSVELQDKMRRFGSQIQSAGGIFLQLEIWNLRPLPPEADREPFPRAEGDAVGTLYNMENVGVPCVVLINPEGRIQEMLIGYVPGNTEQALSELLKIVQTGSKKQP